MSKQLKKPKQSLEDIFGMPSQEKTKKRTFEEIWGVETKPNPSPATPKKKSFEEIWGVQPETPTSKNKQSLEEIFGDKPESKPKKTVPKMSLESLNILVNPFYNRFSSKPQNPKKYGPVRQTLVRTAAEFLKGLNYGEDMVEGEEGLTKANKTISSIGRPAGELSRMLYEQWLGGKLVGALGSLGKASKVSKWTTKALGNSKVAESIRNHAPGLLSNFADDVARGVVVSGIDQALAPKGRKPGIKGTAMNAAMFGAGGIGSRLARDILLTKVPKVNPHIENLTSIVGDTLTSTAVGLPFVDDDDQREQLIKDSFGPQVLAIGVYDVLAYAVSKGKVKPSSIPHVEQAAAALEDFTGIDSEGAQQEFWDSINKVELNKADKPSLVLYHDDNKSIKPREESIESTLLEGKGKTIPAKDDSLIYLTSKKEASEGMPEDGLDQAILEASFEKTWDVETGLIPRDQAETRLKELKINNEQAKSILDKSADEATGQIKTGMLFDDENLPVMKKALKEAGYDSVHYADNRIGLDPSKVKPKKALSDTEELFDDFMNEPEQLTLFHFDDDNTSSQEKSYRLDAGMTVSLEDEQLKRIQRLASDMTKPLSTEEIQKVHSQKPPDAPFNLGRMDARTGALIGLDEIARELDDDTVVHLSETEAEAQAHLRMKAESWQTLGDELGMSMDEYKDIYRQTHELPQKLVKMRAHLVASAGEMYSLADKIGSGSATELDYAKFLYRVQIHSALTPLIKGSQTNIARTLSAFRIIVPEKGWMSLGDLDLDDLKVSPDAMVHVDDLVNRVGGGVDNIKKMAEKIKKAKTLADVTKTTRQITEESFSSKVARWFQSAILTNPVTHLGNIAGQTINDMLERVTDVVQLGVGTVRGIALPQIYTNDRATVSEVMKGLSGDIQGLFHAFINPRSIVHDDDDKSHIVQIPSLLDYVLQTGKALVKTPMNLVDYTVLSVINPKRAKKMIEEGSIDPYSKMESESSSILPDDGSVDVRNTSMIGLVGKVFEQVSNYQELLSFGLLELGDRPFSYGAYFSKMKKDVDWIVNMSGLKGKLKEDYRRELESATLAYREASKSGEAMPSMMSRITGEDLVDMVKEIDSMAIDHERVMTWKDPINPDNGIPSRLSKKVESTLNEIPAMRVLIPFWHTPVKILERWSSYTPGINLWARETRNDLQGNNGLKAFDRAVAKMVVGTTLYGIGLILALDGRITPSAADEQQRRQMRDANVPEKSINIGTKDNPEWIEINRLDPASMFLGLMADAINLSYRLDSDSASDVFMALLKASSKNTTEKSYMTGFRNIISVMTLDKTNVIDKTLEGFMPFSGLTKYVRENTEDSLQEVNSLMERLRLTNTHDLLDSFGKPIPNPSRIFGLKISETSESPVRIEAGRVGANFTPPGNTIYQTSITPEQRWQIHKSLDDDYHLEDMLNELIQSSEYQEMSDLSKKDALESLYTDVKHAAEAKAFSEDPELQKAYEDVIQAIVEGYQGTTDKKTYAPWFEK